MNFNSIISTIFLVDVTFP